MNRALAMVVFLSGGEFGDDAELSLEDADDGRSGVDLDLIGVAAGGEGCGGGGGLGQGDGAVAEDVAVACGEGDFGRVGVRVAGEEGAGESGHVVSGSVDRDGYVLVERGALQHDQIGECGGDHRATGLPLSKFHRTRGSGR